METGQKTTESDYWELQSKHKSSCLCTPKRLAKHSKQTAINKQARYPTPRVTVIPGANIHKTSQI